MVLQYTSAAVHLIGPISGKDLMDAHAYIHGFLDVDAQPDSLLILTAVARKYPRSSDKAYRIGCRLIALLEVIEHPMVRAWSFGTGGYGRIMIDELLFKVAARHRLRADTIRFEPDSFYSEMLRRTNVIGTA